MELLTSCLFIIYKGVRELKVRQIDHNIISVGVLFQSWLFHV
jgi:hypothetical protein